MPLAHMLLLLLAACAALFLHGCGKGGADKPVSKKTTVILMRHCIRSTDDNGLSAQPGYTYYNNYSSKAWPGFSVPPMFCLPRGERIVQAQGRWMQSQGFLPLPLRAIADNVPSGQRDNVTMHNLLKGLALDGNDVTTSLDHAPFAKGDSDECKKLRLNDTATKKAMLDFINANPPPPDYEKNLKRLYEALGKGVAGNWIGIPCTAGNAPYLGGVAMPVGACSAAADLTERLLMEWGGGIAIAWGEIAASDLPALMSLHAWQFYVWFACPASYNWQAASITRYISASLTDAEPGTTLYVGHDDDIMMTAGALGLSWDAAPFSGNVTLPGSMLRFDLDDDTVTASYHYVANFSDAESHGEMLNTPAHFSHSSNKIALETFQRLVEQGTLEACASSQAVPRNSPAASIVTV